MRSTKLQETNQTLAQEAIRLLTHAIRALVKAEKSGNKFNTVMAERRIARYQDEIIKLAR